jgi:hypothetical protein
VATTCPTCQGNKKVACSTCSGTGLVKCTTCNGTGKVTCTRCGGSGKIPPNPPTGLRVTSDGGSGNGGWVSLNWNGVNQTGVNGYFVIYDTDSGVTPDNYTNYIFVSGQNSTSATLTALTAGQSYYFIVTAHDTDNLESTASNLINAYPGPPAKPSGLSASASSGTISLYWNANFESDLASPPYVVHWNTSNNSGQVNAYGSSCMLSSLTNGKQYTISVTASDKYGNVSSPSDPVNAVPYSVGAAPQVWPIATSDSTYNWISHTFGEVEESSNGFNSGIDIDPSGTPSVLAVLDGQVEDIQRYAGANNYIRIRHQSTSGWNSRKTLYVHLDPSNSLNIGDPVYVGMPLGNVRGDVGQLHFEMWLDAFKVNPLYNNFDNWDLGNVPGYPTDNNPPLIKNAFLSVNGATDQIQYQSTSGGISEAANDWCQVNFTQYNSASDRLYAQGNIRLITNAVDSKVNAGSGSQGNSVTLETVKYQVDGTDKYEIEFDGIRTSESSSIEDIYHMVVPCETEYSGEDDYFELYSLTGAYLYPHKLHTNNGIWNTTGYTDGTHSLTIYCEDAAGNVASKVITINVDNQPPTGSIVINAGAGYTNTPQVTLTLNAQDPGSGVYDMRVSNHSDFSDNPAWEPYVTTKNWTLDAGTIEGSKAVYVQFRDLLEHVSATASKAIILDTTPPTGSLIIKHRDTGKTDYAKSVNVYLCPTATDNGTVSKMQFSNDGSTFSSWVDYSSADYAWTLTSGDGPKTVWANYKDGAGNQQTGTITVSIILDTVPPNFDTKILSPTVIAGIGNQITFAYKSNEIADVRISVANQSGELQVLTDWTRVDPALSYNQVFNGILNANGNMTLLSNGNYYLKVELRDQAWNYYSDGTSLYYPASFQVNIPVNLISISLKTPPNLLGTQLNVPVTSSNSGLDPAIISFKSQDPQFPGLIVAEARGVSSINVPIADQLQVTVTKPGYATQTQNGYSSSTPAPFICSSFAPCKPEEAGYRTDVDTDGDGLPDGWEYKYWNSWPNYTDACGCNFLVNDDTLANGGDGDQLIIETRAVRGDGLSNKDEYLLQQQGFPLLDPRNVDLIIEVDWMVSPDHDYMPKPYIDDNHPGMRKTAETVFLNAGVKVHWAPQSHIISIPSDLANSTSVTMAQLEQYLTGTLGNYGSLNMEGKVVHAIFAPGWSIIDQGKPGAAGIYLSPGVPPNPSLSPAKGVYVFDMHTRNIASGRVESMGDSPILDKYEAYILCHEIGHALKLPDTAPTP